MKSSRVSPGLPFSVDVGSLSDDELTTYLEALEGRFQGRYAQSKTQFLELLADLKRQYAEGLLSGAGPYVGLSEKREGGLAIHCHKYQPSIDMMVYTFDQIMPWVNDPETFLCQAKASAEKRKARNNEALELLSYMIRK